MSEHDANLLTLIIVVVTFPIVGACKWYLADVIVRNTHTKTPIGTWLVRMFVAIGLTFALIGSVYGMELARAYQWFAAPIWVRWWLRLAAVDAVLLALLSTGMLVKHLLPLLPEFEETTDVHPHGVASEVAAGIGIVITTAGLILAALMLIVDWV